MVSPDKNGRWSFEVLELCFRNPTCDDEVAAILIVVILQTFPSKAQSLAMANDITVEQLGALFFMRRS